jgi:biotin synthase
MGREILRVVEEKLLTYRDQITFEEACKLAFLEEEYFPQLLYLSNRVLREYRGKGVYLCSIVSAKTGACPEDCAFCAQSARARFPIASHPMLEPHAILEAAKRAERNGASEFCIVASGRGPDSKTFKMVLDAVSLIRTHTSLSVGCSLGILTREQARLLYSAGVSRYNHNLETARSFFPRICTTHTYEERVRTAHLVKESGMELCSGGILGMGESIEQRIELAFELREVNPDIVPINLLNPRPGTALEGASLLEPLEAVKSIALFRLILPDKIIVCAGGREVVLKDLQPLALFAGANALITGNYLTTPGQEPEMDLAMIKKLGMEVFRYNP